MRACVHAQVLCILRVFMSLYLLLMWFVSYLSSVLVLLFMLYSYSFRSQFSVVGGILFTPKLECYLGAPKQTWRQTIDCCVAATPNLHNDASRSIDQASHARVLSVLMPWEPWEVDFKNGLDTTERKRHTDGAVSR